MHALIELISSGWFWLTVFISVIGAVVVYWGLKVGADAEKLLPPTSFKEDIFGDIVKRYKAEIDRGHKILMWGVAIEAICALAVCVISGLENVDLKAEAATALQQASNANLLVTSNELQIAVLTSNNLVLQTNVLTLKTNLYFMDPSNWKVVSLYAEVRMRINLPSKDSDTPNELHFQAILTVSDSSIPNWPLVLTSDVAVRVDTQWQSNPRLYVMTFSNPFRPTRLAVRQFFFGGTPANVVASGLDTASLVVTNFPDSAYVNFANATIIINNAIQKQIRFASSQIENGFAVFNQDGGVIPPQRLAPDFVDGP